ncbi:hypothetical protein CU669_04285 [Paramagnetospirillum kuznetsovii]|uniref:EAL domain-containing protein n=1 Tax=Paramagnetospirillum kuznetsovii TaxID=2053833 RepID=A0A364P245_9PROT|nr:hypothetical protein [Paramagnetospirillum kuznetsovii]RAU23356.1 hypothetical protein CU669_04285 [Paramagnetospirillum kuznetsovii]
MNAGAFGTGQQEVVTPENLLFDAAERVGRIREGRVALHLHLSQLLPANRDEGRIRIAFRLFETMVDAFRGQMFLLSNNDIVLICKDARISELDAMVFKLRALFSTDPLTYAESAEGADRFVTYYDLEADFDTFFSLCGEMVSLAKKSAADQRRAPQIQSLDSKTLTKVLERIGATDIAGVVRRQACIQIHENMTASVAFQEFFMSIMDLQKVLAPDVNILSNRWLFQHLSQILDLRVLSVLQDSGFRKMPDAFSVNLNMATIETPVFQQFEASVRGRAGVVVEFQLLDIFNDLDGFFRARDKLRSRGHKSVLDGMSPLTLQFMDAELFDTDYVKLAWSTDMIDDIKTAELQHALGPVGYDRVILSRCDTETSISWGLSQGIRMFQGRFLDSMISAVTMAQCDKSSACTLNQCTQRHGVITGRPRAECGNNDMLDAFPPLRAIR